MPARIRRLLPYIIIITAAVIFHGWSAWMWHSNFDSDEAIPALMAKRMMEWKEFPVYFYGHNYGGSLSSLLAIPFIAVFGMNVIAIRLSIIVCLLAFYILHALYTHKIFGRNTAIISLIYLAFPGFSLHTFITRFSAWWHIYILVWMGLLLLYTFPPKKPAARAGAVFASGVLIGINLWTVTSTLMYTAVLLVAWLLQSEEWKRVHAILGGLFHRVTRLSGDIPFAIIGGTFAIISPLLLWTRYTMPFVIATLLGLLLAYIFSLRKKVLTGYFLLLLAGFAVGDFPQWGGWYFWGVAPDNGYHPHIPSSTVLQKFAEIVPANFLGVRAMPWLFTEQPIYEWVLGGSIAILAIAMVVFFCRQYKKVLLHLFTLKPLEPANTHPALFFVLFAATWVAVMGISAYTEGTVRYMATAWQPFALFSGIFFAALIKKNRWIGGILLTVWTFHFCIMGTVTSSNMWKYNFYDEQELQEVETYLTEQNVTVGYADFWDAYTLNFLTQERLIISEYQRFRFVPYKQILADATTKAYLMRFYVKIPVETTSLEALAQGIKKREPYADVLPDLTSKTLLSRKKIGTWDIWIVRD